MGCTKGDHAAALAAYELGLLPADERKELLEHVLECDDCFRDLYETEPVASHLHERGELRPQLMRVPDAAAEASPHPTVVPGLRGRRRWPRAAAWGGGLAAAAVLLVVGAALLAPSRDGQHLRGDESGSVVVLAPHGEVPAATELTWAPLAGVGAYEVRIHSSQGELLWRETVAAPPARLPEAVREALLPGGTYFWQVDVLLPDGSRATSALTSFTIGP